MVSHLTKREDACAKHSTIRRLGFWFCCALSISAWHACNKTVAIPSPGECSSDGRSPHPHILRSLVVFSNFPRFRPNCLRFQVCIASLNSIAAIGLHLNQPYISGVSVVIEEHSVGIDYVSWMNIAPAFNI